MFHQILCTHSAKAITVECLTTSVLNLKMIENLKHDITKRNSEIMLHWADCCLMAENPMLYNTTILMADQNSPQ